MSSGKFATVASVAVVLAVPSAAFGDPGPDSPTATHDNPSSCLGAERATRNSPGGDRAHGGFGQAQSAWVHELQEAGINYGQWLAEWKEDCS